MQPEGLTLRLLEDITDGFSEERKVGQGAYGKVYRGEHKNGEQIAVKKLYYDRPGLDDKQFENEFLNLKRLEHQNIVQLVGYCYETQYESMEYNGRTIFAGKTFRALCLEYMHNGSLEKHLYEECDGHDWHTRYKIIKGTCEGLKYLHEGLKEPIYHLDLKPGNILLDENMVPKLADFGLSKLFGEEKTMITTSFIGTPGYLPPEYIEKNVVSNKFDIFSLGVVMIEIITGPKGRSESVDMRPQEFIDLVHENWRNRLQETWSGSALEAYCQQVKRCTEIALNCLEIDRQKRPDIASIIDKLNEMDTVIDKYPGSWMDKLLAELHFPVEPNELIPCVLHLTNNTDDPVMFRFPDKIPSDYLARQVFGVVPPRCSYTTSLVIPKLLQPPRNRSEFCTLESFIVGSKDQHRVGELHTWEQYNRFFDEAKYTPTYMRPNTLPHRVDVKLVVYVSTGTAIYEIIQKKDWLVSTLDVHPTEPWIMTTHRDLAIDIWNYPTQACQFS